MFTRWYAPDVVLLVSPALFSSAIARWKARFLVRRPIGTWVQDLYSLGIVETGVGGGRVAAIVARVERQVLRDSDGVAAIHDRFAAVMTERLGVDPASITVIRNWTHLPPAPVVDAAAVRARHGWGDETVVLHAGNQGAKQALENVVAAARIADDRALPIRFVLLGDGNQRDELETLSIGISRIQFISPLPGIEFQEAMAGSDVLLVNERVGVTEMAVPSKLTSYFSMGKPVLAATDEGSVTAGEIAASEGGIRVDAGRPIALLEAIRSLADDPDRARALGEAGRRFMERTLSEAAAVDRYEAWLASLSARR
jgi:glycosyltransferase involved in cell wall biosynthesis